MLRLRQKPSYLDSVPLFSDLDEFLYDPGCERQQRYYELSLVQNPRKFNLPFQLGYSVLQLAKLAFAEFVYDFFGEYYRSTSFQPIYCKFV